MKKYIQYIRSKILGRPTLEQLIKKGLIVGNNFNIQRDCIIDEAHCWLIEIGDNVTLAPRVHILAHDASTKNFLGYTKIGNVKIGNNVFVGSSTTILPNVKIGDNVILGSNSVVTKDIPSNSVAVGNPSKIICSLDEYLKKHKKNMNEKYIFDSTYTIKCITEDKKFKMKSILENSIGFIE